MGPWLGLPEMKTTFFFSAVATLQNIIRQRGQGDGSEQMPHGITSL
jgi:hypothetical protein